MILCDYCGDWFHLDCVEVCENVDNFQCPACKLSDNTSLIYDPQG